MSSQGITLRHPKMGSIGELTDTKRASSQWQATPQHYSYPSHPPCRRNDCAFCRWSRFHPTTQEARSTKSQQVTIPQESFCLLDHQGLSAARSVPFTFSWWLLLMPAHLVLWEIWWIQPRVQLLIQTQSSEPKKESFWSMAIIVQLWRPIRFKWRVSPFPEHRPFPAIPSWFSCTFPSVEHSLVTCRIQRLPPTCFKTCMSYTFVSWECNKCVFLLASTCVSDCSPRAIRCAASDAGKYIFVDRLIHTWFHFVASLVGSWES